LGINRGIIISLKPHVTIVIPAFQEGQSIKNILKRIDESVKVPFECIIVTDSEDDSTNCFVNEISAVDTRFQKVLTDLGRGPAFAIRKGIVEAKAEVVVVTMADGSDDPVDIDQMVSLVQRGVSIVSASRYMPGGQQIGAPLIKSLLSRLAGKTLYWFGRVGTRDSTNSFKAYDKEFLDSIEIESKFGFEMGLELVAKAKRRHLLVAEIPTIWIERFSGESNFKILRWIPRYLKWYFHAFGRRRQNG
jgi:glycosyltransferase involved in cell wall biosynthesis